MDYSIFHFSDHPLFWQQNMRCVKEKQLYYFIGDTKIIMI